MGATAMTELRTELTSDDLERMSLELRNWGRWGPEDERGALNLITDAKRADAASLVREGVTVSCAQPLPVAPAPDNPTPVQHHMVSGGDAADPKSRFGIARDYFAIAPHGMATTHLDALCHIFVEGKMYNGYDKAEVRTDGAQRNSIMSGSDGIVSRACCSTSPGCAASTGSSPAIRSPSRNWARPRRARVSTSRRVTSSSSQPGATRAGRAGRGWGGGGPRRGWRGSTPTACLGARAGRGRARRRRR